MQISIKRILQGKYSALSEIYIEGQLVCYGLENCAVGVFGSQDSLLAFGEHEIALYRYGAMHARYHRMFAGLHLGMLHILGDPDRRYAYIHVGKNLGATSEGLLVAMSYKSDKCGDFILKKSKAAYKLLYRRVIDAMDRGEKVVLDVALDQPVVVTELSVDSGQSTVVSNEVAK